MSSRFTNQRMYVFKKSSLRTNSSINCSFVFLISEENMILDLILIEFSTNLDIYFLFLLYK